MKSKIRVISVSRNYFSRKSLLRNPPGIKISTILKAQLRGENIKFISRFWLLVLICSHLLYALDSGHSHSPLCKIWAAKTHVEWNCRGTVLLLAETLDCRQACGACRLLGHCSSFWIRLLNLNYCWCSALQCLDCVWFCWFCSHLWPIQRFFWSSGPASNFFQFRRGHRPTSISVNRSVDVESRFRHMIYNAQVHALSRANPEKLLLSCNSWMKRGLSVEENGKINRVIRLIRSTKMIQVLSCVNPTLQSNSKRANPRDTSRF